MSLDTTEKKITQINDVEIRTMKNTSAYALPNTPANAGMKASQVKPKFYDFVLKENGVSIVTLMKRIVDELNVVLRDYQNNFIDLDIEKQDIDNKITIINQQINDINTLLRSDDVNLDTLQELVNALKNNVSSINDIFTLLSTKANKEDVMGIVNENSTEVDTLNIGTSENFDETSDNEIPTTKAVKTMIGSGGGSGENNSFKLVSSSNGAVSFKDDGYNYILIDKALQSNKLYLVEVALGDYYCMFKLMIKKISEWGSLSTSSVQPIRIDYSEETWLYNFINYSLCYTPNLLGQGPAIGFEPLSYADIPILLEEYYSTASVNVYELGGIVNE